MTVRAEPKASPLIKQLVLEFPGSDRSSQAKPDVGTGKGVDHAASAPGRQPNNQRPYLTVCELRGILHGQKGDEDIDERPQAAM